MEPNEIIDKTIKYVRDTLEGEGSGHDWWHVYRVWKTAHVIGEKEGADLVIVELAALLHDIADWKFHEGDEDIGPKTAEKWLTGLNLEQETIAHITGIIKNISFKGAGVADHMDSLEGKVVQDADRLDAIGAIGIARCFAYGGYTHREIYNPDKKPELHENKEKYKNSDSPSINHFYEKLLLLKDRMNTKTAVEMANERHQFMEQFLEHFYLEWDAEV
ncbi:HD domain-containing protein [candidate division WWE3 bacterium]|uniref:HD domain-containing protein n=1 Tax=candidate division WWE3 bacterium TaxID=2053526 RepID=A0A955RPV4_UNCKA|nr:HD domain-containing protein [candidate division WWE3 bacterium]